MSDKLQIVYMSIKDLKPYKKNAKKHTAEQINRIAESIKEFGFKSPVLIDQCNCVVAGHGRVMGAKKAGLKEVPVIRISDLTEDQVKAYRLVDNKLNESEWDSDLLNEEIKEFLKNDAFDMSLFGFDNDIIQSIRSNILSSSPFADAISQLPDDEIMESIKPRNLQSPSQLMAWSKYIQSVIEERINVPRETLQTTENQEVTETTVASEGVSDKVE